MLKEMFSKMDGKQKVSAIVLAIAISFYAGSRFLSFAGGVLESYEAYSIKEEIASIDSDKRSLVESNSGEILAASGEIFRLKERISYLSECNSKVTYGNLEEYSCDAIAQRSIVPHANAQETTERVTTTPPAPVATQPIVLPPEELFYVTKVSDGCHVSQGEEDHYEKRNGGVLATDVACRFGQPKAQRATVYVPDYAGKAMSYTVTKVGNNQLLGNYVELEFCPKEDCDAPMKWVIAHLETKKKEGDKLSTGMVLGQMDLSGATTGYHSHVELWAMLNGQWTNVSYTTRSKSLDNRRNGKLDDTVVKGDYLYSTSYDLGDVNQNDASPFIGASGKDLRHVENPIAITSDIRKLYGLKFGDKVRLEGKCSGTYSVEDEMNIRFRTSCIRKGKGCIKMDIARKPGETKDCSGAYLVTKL